MGKIETAMKSEITRLARRQVRDMTARSADEIRKLRRRVIALERELTALKNSRAKEQTRRKVQKVAETVASDEGGQTRLSPRLIQTLRKRLNVSQAELGRLVGVSSVTVGNWESGKSKPRPEAKAKVVALRSLGRREVKRLLAEQQATA
jgi:DNA-binding transcriptional regulator YiaG